MALNIKDPESERLAGEIAAITGESKTGAIRTALRERRERLRLTETVDERRARLERSLADLWSQIPPDRLGGPPVTRAEREEILGLGPEGT